MPTDSYHSDFDAISKTMLNTYVDSPFEYWHYYVRRDMQPPGPKKQMLIGSAVHAVLLEKFDYDAVAAVYDESCFKRSKKTRELTNSLNPVPAEEFRDLYSDKIVLKPSDMESVVDVCDSVLRHPLGELIRHPDAVFEQPIYWTCPETGMQCRCCPDFHIDLGDKVLGYDLKVTEQIYPRDFERVSNRFRYWLQEAHYGAGLQAKYGKPVEFVFWGIEAGGHCRVGRFEYDTAAKENCRDAYLMHMRELKQSYEQDHWVDKWTAETVMMSVNPFSLGLSDELEFDDEEEADDDSE